MSECTDRRIGRMLFDYGLGILNEDEVTALEIHLMECPYCYNLARELGAAETLIKDDPEGHKLVHEMERAATAHSRPVHPDGERARAGSFSRWRIVALVAAVVVLAVVTPWVVRFETTDEAVASPPHLMVAPFGDPAGVPDSSRLGDIVSSLLAADLSTSKEIYVVSDQYLRDVQARLEATRSDTTVSLNPLDLATAAGVKWLVTGEVETLDSPIVIAVRLVDVGKRTTLTAFEQTQEQPDLFSEVDAIAARIRSHLVGKDVLAHETDPPVVDITTGSLRAYRWYLEGFDYLRRYNYQDAEFCFKRAVELDTSFALAYYQLAYLGVPDMLEHAVVHAENATPREQHLIEFLRLVRSGNAAAATESLEDFVEKYPEDKKAWVTLSVLRRGLHEYDEARVCLLKAVAIDSSFGEAWNELGGVYSLMGEVDEALSALARYQELSPNDPNPYDTRGSILARHGRLDEAIAAYEEACKIDPDFANCASQLALGRLYIYRGDDKAAASCFHYTAGHGDALARAAARMHLALIPLYRGKLRESLQLLQDGIEKDYLEMDPSRDRMGIVGRKRMVAAMVLDRLGEVDSAVAMVRKAMNETDSVPGAACLFAPTLINIMTREGKITEAQRLVDQWSGDAGYSPDWCKPRLCAMSVALEEARGNPQNVISIADDCYADSDLTFLTGYRLALAHMALGHYETAAAKLQALLSDYTDQDRLFYSLEAVTAYYDLALAQESAGQYDLAVAHYKEFMDQWAEADPELDSLRVDAERRLARLSTSP